MQFLLQIRAECMLLVAKRQLKLYNNACAIPYSRIDIVDNLMELQNSILSNNSEFSSGD